MIKGKRKSQKGITLVSLSIAIVVMLVITSTLIYSITTGDKVKALNNMYQDITKIKDKVDLYYATYRALPIIKTPYENINHIQPINPNDNDNYYVVDLEALQGLYLNFGKDYKGYQKKPGNNFTDIYIINERSHMIYYVDGIRFEDNIYYTMPEESTKVELSNILNIELVGRNDNVVSIKMNAVDKENGIKKITLMVNDEAYKVYEYEADYREIKTELEKITLTQEENICYFQIEDESGNMKLSNDITVMRVLPDWSDTYESTKLYKDESRKDCYDTKRISSISKKRTN
ncbi:MAG: type II secretion system protein [Clostridia bacterium]|nr:type II secretion system protein [Clostridia bacterium]